MAIVFISPKAKQKIFLRITSTVIILAVGGSLLVLFIVALANSTPITPLSSPLVQQQSVSINFNIIDSDQVENLEPFYQLQIPFTYMVESKDEGLIEGIISAVSEKEAKDTLEKAGYKVVNIKESNIGRSEPFTSY